MFTQYHATHASLIEAGSLALVPVATPKTITSDCLAVSNSYQNAVASGDSTLTEIVELGNRIGSRFARAEPRRQAEAYLKGLFSPVPRKNSWQLAEVVGDKTPDGIQRLLNTAVWDVDGIRDDLRDYVVEYMGDPDGALIIDESGFLKKGSKSVGVKRQYSGTAGKVDNCQIGVFLSYASRHGRTLLDRELYHHRYLMWLPHR